jgi:dTDP-4-amino-4,6-dideoxygalactose transaminase
LNKVERINVTKTFLPPIEDYQVYLRKIWDRGQITNQGPLLLELEHQLNDYLEINNLHFVTNGTVALQIALRALCLDEGEIITTPFSYVATASSILWERYKPIFVDIDPDNFCIDASKIEDSITSSTKAIMAVHVFGNPCDVEKIEAVASKRDIKVIYDAAHAFGVKYDGKSLLSYGDISTCSFHATKLFHTIEGGAVIARDKEISGRVELMKRFGHNADDHYMLGINAKASEFQAAMGLCNLKYMNEIIAERKKVSEYYDRQLKNKFQRPRLDNKTQYNYGYYPIVLESEDDLLRTMATLEKQNIYPRRYFYPSLNTLPYLEDTGEECPISEDISSRILCLPLYVGLKESVVYKICEVMS